MRYSSWISLTLTLSVAVIQLESKKWEPKSNCQVSALHLACTSSNTVLFKWDYKSKWKYHCKNLIFKVKYFQNRSKETLYYSRADIEQGQLFITGLQSEKEYEFNFVQYININNQFEQINGSFKKIKATPLGVGGVESLMVGNITSTSVKASWLTQGEERHCIARYEVQWCRTDSRECRAHFVANLPELCQVHGLTPCASYTLTITAIGIDEARSSKTANQTFTTHSEVAGSVSDLAVHNATPGSLSISWTGRSCSYTVSISDARGFITRKHQLLSLTTSGTVHTFTSLKPCSLYNITVSTQDGSSSNLQAYTSVVSDAAVSSMRVSKATDSSLSIVWQPPSPWLKCVCGYKVQVASGGNVTWTGDTVTSSVLVSGLEPCTDYRVAVTVIFPGNTLSLESSSVQGRTGTPARFVGQPVRKVSVVNQRATLLSVTWEAPDLGAHCVLSYGVFLYNSQHRLVYNNSKVPSESRAFTFVNLKQCEPYHIYVTPVFDQSIESTPYRGLLNFTDTFTASSDDVSVANLTMETSWTSLHLRWSTPPGYEPCTRRYEVRVCATSECSTSSVEEPSYLIQHLPACTEYIVQVWAQHSNSVSTISGVTRGTGTITSSQLQVINKTSESISFKWGVTENFINCEGYFVISLQDDSKFVIESKKLNHSAREFTAQNLKSCSSYSLALSLQDFTGQPTIQYIIVKDTTKASDSQKVENLEASLYDGGVVLGWTMAPDASCISSYQVTMMGCDGSSTIYNTKSSTFRWTGNPCGLISVSVQPLSGRQLVGASTQINLRQQLEDLSKLSVRIDHVDARSAEVRLISFGFVCVSDYVTRWSRVGNLSKTDTTSVANLTGLPNKKVTLRNLDPCTTYVVTMAPRNGPNEFGVLNTTLTTNFDEPMLVPTVITVHRGFNISWHLSQPDARRCLSHIKVALENKNTLREINVFSDSHTTFEGLTPCEEYLITVDGVSQEKIFGRTYYRKWIRVKPEVLPVPAMVTVVKVTKDSATLEWDVGTSDDNNCEPSDLKVDCRPDAGVNSHIAGWSPATLWLSRLTPHTRYSCELTVVNEAGRSNATHISFITLEGVPSMPRNVSVITWSSEALVTWAPPDQVPGVLTSYTVIVDNQTLTYQVPPACPTLPLGPRRVTVGGNTTQATMGGLSPAVAFVITVTASTAAGAGPPSSPVTATTQDGDGSSPVLDLNVTLTSGRLLLSWRPPCLTNGPLEHFTIRLDGTRPGHEVASYTWNLPVQQLLSDSYSTDFNASLLTAEANYTATVFPVGASGSSGQNSTCNFTVPSRIPPGPNQLMAMLPTVRTTHSTAIISIRSDLFPDTEGTIRFYAIIVAGNFSYGPQTGWIHNHSWPRMTNWAKAMLSHPVAAYQATQPWWNPFSGLDSTLPPVKQFILGSEECSKSDYKSFCNGALLPGTFYAVRIRAFTLNGYRDSPSIVFQTADPIVEEYLIILALIALAAATTVAFIYLSARGHIKWVNEKKEIIKSKSNHHKEKPTIREPLPLVKFINHMENILTSGGLLDKEYKQVTQLTNQIAGTTNIAKLPCNAGKNRYRNIIPYDTTLVKLEGDETNNYINASHIKIQGKKSRQYIACQGPKEETCGDFWRMIIQYKVNTVVMLCMPRENGKVKCFTYFPITEGEVVSFDGISIYCTRKEVFTNYVVRYLTIVKEGTKMKVQQFHFTCWNDHDVPAKPEDLVEFIHDIRKSTTQKHHVMTVHCSAGVGRTGTFVALCELLRKIRSSWSCRLSVADTVLQLRQQRHAKMVQTQEQYLFIYQCLKFDLQHHKSFSERVRNSFIWRSKVELGAGEMIIMDTLPAVIPTDATRT